jgi:alkylhydroperoxidase family enzyme
VEFLRVASGEAAVSLAVLQKDDESLPPRARALVRLARALTAQPWALPAEVVADAARQGLDRDQLEAAVGVIAMFNYFTRVADATGIEFDYLSPLPAFEPDVHQAVSPRPSQSGSSEPGTGAGRRRPRYQPLRQAWQSWRSYVLESDKPIGQRQRWLLACVAAEESADGDQAGALGGFGSLTADDDEVVRFARKVSCEPWRMTATDLERLRSVGYSDEALLHIISVVAHQNADSRLTAGLRAVNQGAPGEEDQRRNG